VGTVEPELESAPEARVPRPRVRLGALRGGSPAGGAGRWPGCGDHPDRRVSHDRDGIGRNPGPAGRGGPSSAMRAACPISALPESAAEPFGYGRARREFRVDALKRRPGAGIYPAPVGGLRLLARRSPGRRPGPRRPGWRHDERRWGVGEASRRRFPRFAAGRKGRPSRRLLCCPPTLGRRDAGGSAGPGRGRLPFLRIP